MDFSIHICEYNRSNADYDIIYRPEGSGDYLFLLFKTPMRVYAGKQFSITQENACIFLIFLKFYCLLDIFNNFSNLYVKVALLNF